MSGVFWERHCREALLSVGFEKFPGWESVYIHRGLKLVLAVYVDDFKLVGLKNNIPKGWELIGSKNRLDPPTKLGEYLGCGQESFLQRKKRRFVGYLMASLPLPLGRIPASGAVLSSG